LPIFGLFNTKPKMKNLLITIICLSCLAASSQNYSGDTWAQVKAKSQGTITLTYVETPSFVYKDNAGSLTGICVDVMNDFIKWANDNKKIKINAVYMGDGANFRTMYDKVKASSGGVFGLGNITITEERKKEVKFSPSYITNIAFLISQNSVPTLANMEDFKTIFGKLTAYTAKGTLNEKRINELKKNYNPDMKITLTSTSQEAYEKVVSDANGFAYLDLAFYLEAVSQRKPVKRHPVGDQSSEKFALIMPLNSDWGPALQEFFDANGGYTNSAQYKAILRKHLGETGVKLLQAAM
jgi:ABC-type amino acid transport substrate-binding protein